MIESKKRRVNIKLTEMRKPGVPLVIIEDKHKILSSGDPKNYVLTFCSFRFLRTFCIALNGSRIIWIISNNRASCLYKDSLNCATKIKRFSIFTRGARSSGFGRG